MMSPLGLNFSNRETLAFASTVHREDAGSREYMFSLMSTLTNTLVSEDAAAMIEHATSNIAAQASRVGVTAYCMSRHLSFGLRPSFLRS